MTETEVGQEEAMKKTLEEAKKLGEAFEKSIRISALYLANGVVLRVGEPMLGGDGKPNPHMVYTDADGKEKGLFVGMILEFPDESESLQEDGDQPGLFATTKKARYEVWPKETDLVFYEVPGHRVMWVEKHAPLGYGASRIADSIQDNVVVDDEPEPEPQAPAISTPETPSLNPS